MTLVSVPQQTTALFCGSLSYTGRVIFSPIDSICVTEPGWQRDFKALFLSPPLVVAVVTVVRRLYAGKKTREGKAGEESVEERREERPPWAMLLKQIRQD